MEKNYVPGECPVCGGELKIDKVSCTGCDMQMTGTFYLSGFTNLNERQLEFIKVFIMCKGNIKEVEKELGISYPTVKSRLDEVAGALDVKLHDSDRKDNTAVLESLEKGELSIDEALELLKEKR
ncbi:MAG TPA: DUF2089 domain-containing protein [Clostridia bacterium]|nr:DUF2089 domain-containing protein [Clostridia bacterium]HPQ47260.1 DUF2089 domain-containing protein [Clostridia bacterium]HRX42858.1 DUF2089 domain-containing protein [Clostridia bacterium]